MATTSMPSQTQRADNPAGASAPKDGSQPFFKQVDPKQNEAKHAETVGGKSLADTLNDIGYVHGSFAINGVEFRNFEARSPGEVARLINAKSAQTGVMASVDDGHKLVLSADSPDEISIADLTYMDEREQRLSQEARDRAKDGGAHDQRTADQRRDDVQRGDPANKKQPNILEALGLKPTPELNKQRNMNSSADWSPGASKEDREKARQGDREFRTIGGDNAGELTDAERGLKAGGGSAGGGNAGPSYTGPRTDQRNDGSPQGGQQDRHDQAAAYKEQAGKPSAEQPQPGETDGPRQQPA